MTAVRADTLLTAVRRIAIAVLATVVGALIVAASVFWLAGGRWFVMRTPSMGTAAPVGTLVLTRPVPVAHLHVGDVIAFHPPTEPRETFTHRVVAISDGQVHTRGDINGAVDPWPLRQPDLIGRTVAVLPGLGWAARAVPLLSIGGIVAWGLTRMWLTPARRGPAMNTALGLLFAACCFLLKPFVGVVQLASSTLADGRAQMTVVSTGVLPVRVTPASGHGHAAPVDLSSGQVGVSKLSGGSPGHRYLLDTHLHLTWWQWVAVMLVSCTPLLWTMIVGYRVPAETAQP